MIKINLLPVRETKQKESIKRQIVVFVLSLVFILSVIGGFHISISRKISSIKTEISGINVKMEEFKKVIKEIEEYKDKKRILEEKIKIMKQLDENKRGPLRLLAELSEIIPEKTWLVSLREKKSLIEIKGIAFDNKVIADFMNRIENSPFFEKVDLTISQKARRSGKSKEGKNLKSFTLKFRLESSV